MHCARRIPSFVCLSDWKFEISDWKWLVWPNFAIFFRFYLKCPEMSTIGNFPLERPRKTAEPRCLSFIFGYRSDLFNKTLAQETRTESQSIVKWHKALPRLPENLEATARRASAARLLCLDRSGLSLDEVLYEFWDGVYWNLLQSIESTCICIYIDMSIYGAAGLLSLLGPWVSPQFIGSICSKTTLLKLDWMQQTEIYLRYSIIFTNLIYTDHRWSPIDAFFWHNIQVHSHDFVIIRIVSSSFGICSPLKTSTITCHA